MFAALHNDNLIKFESERLLLEFIKDKGNIKTFILSPLEISKYITHEILDKNDYQIGSFYLHDGGYFIGNIGNKYYFIYYKPDFDTYESYNRNMALHKCNSIIFPFNGMTYRLPNIEELNMIYKNHKGFNSIIGDNKPKIITTNYWSSEMAVAGSLGYVKNFLDGETKYSKINIANNIIPIRVRIF